MERVSTYYPYVLYAIPYLVAAYVLIREQIRRRREKRAHAAASAIANRPIPDIEREETAANENVDTRGSITRMLHRIKSRPAA